MKLSSPGSRFVWSLATGAALLVVAASSAAEFTFSGGLSEPEQAACGLAKVTPSELVVLDELVAHDVTLAHQGGVTGFSSPFSQRRTAAERAAAGIDRLSEKERSALDQFAARAVALGPPPSQAFTYSPPPPAPVDSNRLVSAPLGLEVHGDVSFTVGAGSHGSSFYGTSADVFVTDPSGKFTLGIGIDDYRGKGLFRPLPLVDGNPPWRAW